MFLNSSVKPLDSQVGGHAVFLTTEDGSLVIKPAHPREHNFYQALMTDPAVVHLRPFIPRLRGTLMLEEANRVKAPELGITMKCLVLTNLSHPFSKPNILDIKLGTVLYDIEATPEKILRMEKAARNTTAYETGIRLSAFQVYDNTTGKAIYTPKSYGKSIKPNDLPDAFTRFFPVASTSKTEREPVPSTGLPASLLLPMLKAVRAEIAEFRKAFESVQVRMAGGSLLIIYESDWNMAESGLNALRPHGERSREEYSQEDGDLENDDHPMFPFTVKLIDFAHTHVTPGLGADTGVLQGVDTILRLIDARYEQVLTGTCYQRAFS